MKKKTFPGISPRAYEHPADRAALQALRSIPGLDFIMKQIIALLGGEKSIHLLFLSSAARVGPKQFPKVWESYLEACEILDVKDPPELYMVQTPMVNAAAIGVKKPFVAIHSGLLHLLDEEELQTVMAHELGHIKSGHALYKTIVMLSIYLLWINNKLPLSMPFLYGLVAALYEWDRKSELSADRAGLLVVQNPDVAVSVDMKLAGGGFTKEMSIEAFEEQAEEYESHGTALTTLAKIQNGMWRTHPFPVLRLKEIRLWVKSGEYQKILDGDYPKEEDDLPHLSRDFGEALGAYKSRVGNSTEPLAKGLLKSLRVAGEEGMKGLRRLEAEAAQGKNDESN